MITEKLMLMPTAIKNSTRSNPLNGSISVSSSRCYSLSANSTPAKNAPNAMVKPANNINTAMPTTKSSDAAVKISGVMLRAIERKIGRNNSLPPITMPVMIAITLSLGH